MGKLFWSQISTVSFKGLIWTVGGAAYTPAEKLAVRPIGVLYSKGIQEFMAAFQAFWWVEKTR